MSIKIILFSFACLSLLAFCVGCSTPMVVPNHVHVPLMRKVGEVKMQGQVGTNGVSGSVAVSPLPHLAARGTYSKAWSKETRNPQGVLTDVTHGHELIEAAVGGYLPQLSLAGQNATFELYGGMSLGTVRAAVGQSIFFSNIQVVDAKARQVFIELNVGIRESSSPPPTEGNPAPEGKIFEYGSSFRYSNWQLTEIAYNDILSPLEKQEGNYLQATIFGRLPGKVIFLEAQLGVLYPVSDHPNRPSIASLYVSAGLHFNLFP